MLTAIPAQAAPGDPSIAKAISVRPEATGVYNGTSTVLVPDDGLFEGQQITTGAKGEVQIVFADDTHMVVGPGSTLVIQKYLMRNGGTASTFAVSALGGTFRFITGKSAKSAYSIVTPTATIGIRGTKFDFSVDGKTKRTTVVLFEGQVNICQYGGGTCEQVKKKCEVGYSETGDTGLIKSGDSKHDAATSKFPYIASQRNLRNDFKVGGSGACGQAAAPQQEQKQPKAPEPKQEKSSKPEGKPNPIPDPKPE